MLGNNFQITEARAFAPEFRIGKSGAAARKLRCLTVHFEDQGSSDLKAQPPRELRNTNISKLKHGPRPVLCRTGAPACPSGRRGESRCNNPYFVVPALMRRDFTDRQERLSYSTH
jgi:hypothetical protein